MHVRLCHKVQKIGEKEQQQRKYWNMKKDNSPWTLWKWSKSWFVAIALQYLYTSTSFTQVKSLWAFLLFLWQQLQCDLVSLWNLISPNPRFPNPRLWNWCLAQKSQISSNFSPAARKNLSSVSELGGSSRKAPNLPHASWALPQEAEHSIDLQYITHACIEAIKSMAQDYWSPKHPKTNAWNTFVLIYIRSAFGTPLLKCSHSNCNLKK